MSEKPSYQELEKKVRSLEQELEKSQSQVHTLNEKNRELDCLYGLSKLVADPDNSLDDIINGTANLLSHSMQYPDTAGVKLILEDRVFSTGNLQEMPEKLSRDIILDGNPIV